MLVGLTRARSMHDPNFILFLELPMGVETAFQTWRPQITLRGGRLRRRDRGHWRVALVSDPIKTRVKRWMTTMVANLEEGPIEANLS
jgi:hypothetical protein